MFLSHLIIINIISIISFLPTIKSCLVSFPSPNGTKYITFPHFMIGMGLKGTIPRGIQSISDINAQILAWRYRLSPNEIKLTSQEFKYFSVKNIQYFGLNNIDEDDLYILLDNVWVFQYFSKNQVIDIHKRMKKFYFYLRRNQFSPEVQELMDELRPISKTLKKSKIPSKKIFSISEENEDECDDLDTKEEPLDASIIDSLYNDVKIKKKKSFTKHIIDGFCSTLGIRREKSFNSNRHATLLKVSFLIRNLQSDFLSLICYLSNEEFDHTIKDILLAASNKMSQYLMEYPKESSSSSPLPKKNNYIPSPNAKKHFL